MCNKATIFVYIDEGVARNAHTEVIASIAELVAHKNHAVVPIDAQCLATHSWQDKCRLLVMPGGQDRPYHKRLSGAGNNRIREYVERGGGYLGFCAGGYFGCSMVEFDLGLASEIREKRELNFFPGIARGPAFGAGSYDVNSLRGARATPLILEDGSITYIYYNGGAVFVDAADAEYTNVIASYADIEGCPAAAIECRVGIGKAILTGLHPEYRPQNLPEDTAHARNIKMALIECDTARQKFLLNIMTKLRVFDD